MNGNCELRDGELLMRLLSVKGSRVWGLVVLALALGLSAPAWAKHNKKKKAQAKQEANKDADKSKDDADQADQTDQTDQGADGQQATQQKGPSLRRGNRMEFDARLIRGESAGSGAVFLFERAQRPLPSMIDKRKSFLHGTVDSELGSRWAHKFDEAQKKKSDSQ